MQQVDREKKRVNFSWSWADLRGRLVKSSKDRAAPRARRWILAGLLGALSLGVPTSVQASAEAWLWAETRLPLASEEEFLTRTNLRLHTETRLSERAEGLEMAIVRVGPLFDVSDWLFVGVHGTAIAHESSAGVFTEEFRVELEPNFHGRLGDWTFNDRNRLELRARDGKSNLRYRNQLRLNYAPLGSRLLPFVWDEILLDLSHAQFTQNRLMTGLGWLTSASSRLEVGYIWRTRFGPHQPTLHDHIAAVSLFFQGSAR